MFLDFDGTKISKTNGKKKVQFLYHYFPTNQLMPRQIPSLTRINNRCLSPNGSYPPTSLSFLTLSLSTVMSSVYRPSRAADIGSGGKLVRSRRAAVRRTPYDRPPVASSPNPTSENPNWLSRLIYSPTRTIASGAGKLLSSVFSTDSSSCSSSSGSGSSSVCLVFLEFWILRSGLICFSCY